MASWKRAHCFSTNRAKLLFRRYPAARARMRTLRAQVPRAAVTARPLPSLSLSHNITSSTPSHLHEPRPVARDVVGRVEVWAGAVALPPTA